MSTKSGSDQSRYRECLGGGGGIFFVGIRMILRIFWPKIGMKMFSHSSLQ